MAASSVSATACMLASGATAFCVRRAPLSRVACRALVASSSSITSSLASSTGVWVAPGVGAPFQWTAVRSFAAAPSKAPKKKKKKKGMTFTKRDRPTYDVQDALALVRANSKAKFDESLDIAVQLGVDPRKPGQNIRGVTQLPHGTGKSVRIAVFAQGEKAEEARAAGAAVVGAEDLVQAITNGELDFNKCIATPDVMPLVGRVARILGPKGLMPNPKLGTVTMDVAGAVKAASQGQAEFRVERHGIIMAAVGKMSFSDEALIDNIRAFMIALSNAKPEALKGAYFRHASISSTMGPGFAIEMMYLNPSSVRFMQPASAFAKEDA